MSNFLTARPTPRHIGFYAGALGAFGTIAYTYTLVNGTVISRADSAYCLLMSLLALIAGIHLWRSTACGWRLAWLAMICLALSGFVTSPPAGWPPEALSLPVFQGVMLTAAGFFFSPLAHRDVYGPCFASSKLPHAVFGATPALLIIAGAFVMVSAGGMGRMAGPFMLLATTIGARWVVGPLWALLRGRQSWHPNQPSQ
jgi:hypothetical protein